jgi:hypothetical protein
MPKQSMFLCAVLLALLTGCATHQQYVDNRFTLPEKIEAEQGVLMVKVIGVQPLSVFNAKWQTLSVTDKTSGVSYEMQDTAQPAASYSLFMGTLPKGQYKINGLVSTGPAPGNFGLIPALVIMAATSDHQNIGDSLGSFTVNPGALTNLGTVVSALPSQKNGQPKLAVLADADGKAAALADAEPTAKARIANMPVLGWDNPPASEEAAKALEIIRTSAGNISSIDATADHHLIAGSVLGMLHSRSPEGKWISQSVGSFDTIIYVRALENNRIFAGTDNGKYFLWVPEQDKWLSHRAISEDFRITHVEPMGEAGYAIQATSTHLPTLSKPIKTKILFKPKLEDVTEAKEVLSIDGFSAFGKTPMFYNGEELQVFFNQVGFSRVADRYRINPKTHEKTQDSVPYWAYDMYRVSDGSLVLDRMNGMSIYNSFSKDNGKTWVDNDASGPHTLRYTDANNGYGFTLVSRGWSTVTLRLSKTEDGGKSWKQLGNPIEGSGILPIRIVGKRLFVFTGQKLLSTVDEGATWDTEWPATAGNS